MRAKLAMLCAALAVSNAALSQSYPTKPIRVIVPDGTGSVTDMRVRQVAARLSEQLGQSVVVDNRPGGSWIIGTEAAAKAVADGYTLLVGSIVSHSLNQILFKKLPYRPNEDFIPVTMLTAGPLILVVHASVPASNLRELIELSRTRPDQIGYGTTGLGTPSHLIMEELKRETGARLLMVPYKSAGIVTQDLVGGHLPVTMGFWSILGPYIRSGKVRALAVAAARRLEAAPDIPTFAEAGFPTNLDGYSWSGFFVPAGTPPAIVSKLHSEIARAINSPEIRAQIIETGAEPGGVTPEQFAAMIRADQEKWRRLAAQVEIAQQ